MTSLSPPCSTGCQSCSTNSIREGHLAHGQAKKRQDKHQRTRLEHGLTASNSQQAASQITYIDWELAVHVPGPRYTTCLTLPVSTSYTQPLTVPRTALLAFRSCTSLSTAFSRSGKD